MMRMMVISLLPNQFFHKIMLLFIALSILRSHHRRLKSRSQADRETLMESLSQDRLVIIVIEFGQEAE